jgi:exonuclease III
MDNTINAPIRDDFKIWQQNLRKSPNAWEHMLKNLDPEKYDLACIQEPYLNPVNLANASNLRSYWDVIYPSNHNSGAHRTQVIMLVNKRLSKNNWHIIPIKSPNVMAIELTGQFGKVRIYNIYNPCDSDHTLHFLERHMAAEERAQRLAQGENSAEPQHIVWVGDFNRHHPMWELPHNTHLFSAENLNAAGTLINLLAVYNLIQALPPAIATLEASNTKNLTRPDNVFCSASFEDKFTQCEVQTDLRPVVTDHFPIISTIDLQPERTTSAP